MFDVGSRKGKAYLTRKQRIAIHFERLIFQKLCESPKEYEESAN